MVKNKLIGVKFSYGDAELIKDVSSARGEDVSDFVRRAVKKELASLSYLTGSEKKALGL